MTKLLNKHEMTINTKEYANESRVLLVVTPVPINNDIRIRLRLNFPTEI